MDSITALKVTEKQLNEPQFTRTHPIIVQYVNLDMVTALLALLLLSSTIFHLVQNRNNDCSLS